MASSASSTCGFSVASIALKGRLPSSSKSSASAASAAAAASAGSCSSPFSLWGRGAGTGLGGGGGGGGGTGRGSARGLRGGGGLALGANGIHGFEIDDVAQQDLSFIQLVAPHRQRFEGQR